MPWYWWVGATLCAAALLGVVAGSIVWWATSDRRWML